MSDRLIIRTTGSTGPSGTATGVVASDVTFTPTGTIAATNAQAAIAEVATDAATALSTHESDTTNVHGIADTGTLVTSSSLTSSLALYVTSAAAPELIRDTIGTALTAGTGITVTPNDAGDTITVATTITQYTDEMARDALGTALTAGSGITITPNDGSDTITIAASSTGGASMGVGYTSRSTYYSHGFPGKWTAAESFAWATGFLIAYPVVIGRACSIDRIGAAVTTAVASSTMWVGIYNSNGTAGAPGTLVSGAVSAELDCSTTGNKETTVSVSLTPGVYWFVSQTGATATHRTRTAASGAAYHALPTSGGDRANYVMYVGRTAAVLPSDLSATTFTTYSDTELPHGVMVRFA